MPRTIFPRTSSTKVQGIGLCDFVEFLNSKDDPCLESPLKELFDESINPKLNFEDKSLKVCNPFGGADPSGFLIKNADELIIIDYSWLYFPDSEISPDFIEEYKRTFPGDYHKFMGLDELAYDGQPALSLGVNGPVIKMTPTVEYYNSGRQMVYLLLHRLKCYFGAVITKISVLDPEAANLGYVIEFSDREGKNKKLTYFHRAECQNDRIANVQNISQEQSATNNQKSDAIYLKLSEVDMVFFKAGDGLPESQAAAHILTHTPDDTLILSDAPVEREHANIMYEKAMTQNSGLIPVFSTYSLGYRTYHDARAYAARPILFADKINQPKTVCALLSCRDDYLQAISELPIFEEDIRQTDNKELLITVDKMLRACLLRDITIEEASNLISGLSTEDNIKIIKSLIAAIKYRLLLDSFQEVPEKLINCFEEIFKRLPDNSIPMEILLECPRDKNMQLFNFFIGNSAKFDWKEEPQALFEQMIFTAMSHKSEYIVLKLVEKLKEHFNLGKQGINDLMQNSKNLKLLLRWEEEERPYLNQLLKTYDFQYTRPRPFKF